MDSKTHFVVTFVSLIFLGVIVIKPDGITREDRTCKVERGRIDCHSHTADTTVARSYKHKISVIGSTD